MQLTLEGYLCLVALSLVDLRAVNKIFQTSKFILTSKKIKQMKKLYSILTFAACMLFVTAVHAQWSLTGNTPAAGAEYLGWNGVGANGKALDIKNLSTVPTQPIDFYINTTKVASVLAGGDFNITSGQDGYKINSSYVLRYSGDNNDIFVGVLAGNSSMTGHSNTLVGKSAGAGITSGTSNTAVGHSAGTAVTTGVGTTFVGFEAGIANTTAGDNTAIGYQALHTATTLGMNVAVGYQALYTVHTLCGSCTGGLNTAVGYQALKNSDAYGGCALGFNAGLNNTIGCGIIAIGEEAMKANTEGDYNLAIGAHALASNTLMDWNVAIGNWALNAQAYSSAFSSHNVAVGNWALQHNNPTSSSNGLNNTAVGDYALATNTTGASNTAIGLYASYLNATGSYTVSCGTSAGYNNTASHGTFVGAFAGQSNTTGDGNTFVGYSAGNANQTADNNTFVGVSAGTVSTAAGNTGVGLNALAATTSGASNTGFGYHAGDVNTTGTQNTFVGYNANASGAALSNATAVGNGAVTNATNKVRIGNTSVTVIEGQVAWTWPSDARFKENVSETDIQGLDFILKLRPVSYNFNRLSFAKHIKENTEGRENELQELSKRRSTGFLAQEVEKTIKETGYTSFDAVHAPTNENDNYSLAYGEFVVPLVKAVQELDAANRSLQAQVNALKEQNNSAQPSGFSLEKSTDIDVSLSSNSIVLNQNQPNPFKEQTTISYFIPDNAENVQIIFTDSKGSILKEVSVSEKGKGQLNVYAQDLSSGIYTYTIVADGVTIDIKKMVCTK
jgi:trimeric autotransporter adhesin